LAKALQEGGDISQLQTDQFEQSLLRGRSSLLTDQQNYLQALDTFKLQLGIPPDFLIELDDSPFRPLNEHFQRFEDLFKAYKGASDDALRFGKPDMVAQVRGELLRIATSSDLVKGTKRFRARIQGLWNSWEKLTADELDKRLSGLKDERRKLL